METNPLPRFARRRYFAIPVMFAAVGKATAYRELNEKYGFQSVTMQRLAKTPKP
ncbi:MAG: hypothetical protein LBO72_07030 [Helicobacteraceae bacterium]|nr:hypothetical protein [Helicobacteraceae bacterium]